MCTAFHEPDPFAREDQRDARRRVRRAPSRILSGSSRRSPRRGRRRSGFPGTRRSAGADFPRTRHAAGSRPRSTSSRVSPSRRSKSLTAAPGGPAIEQRLDATARRPHGPASPLSPRSPRLARPPRAPRPRGTSRTSPLERDGASVAAVARSRSEPGRRDRRSRPAGSAPGRPSIGRLAALRHEDETLDPAVVARDRLAAEMLADAQPDREVRARRRPEARRLDPEVVRAAPAPPEAREQASATAPRTRRLTRGACLRGSPRAAPRSTFPPERITPTRLPAKSAFRCRTGGRADDPGGLDQDLHPLEHPAERLDHLFVGYEENVLHGFLDDRERQLARARHLEPVGDRVGDGDLDALPFRERLRRVVGRLRLDAVDLDARAQALRRRRRSRAMRPPPETGTRSASRSGTIFEELHRRRALPGHDQRRRRRAARAARRARGRADRRSRRASPCSGRRGRSRRRSRASPRASRPARPSA